MWGRRIAVAALVLAVAMVYQGSLDGAFAFDDHFAVISNGDASCDRWLGPFEAVLNERAEVLGRLAGVWEIIWNDSVWLSDFWGQDIASDSSHKSYRPVSVLSFRLNDCMSRLLPPPRFRTLPYAAGNAPRPPPVPLSVPRCGGACRCFEEDSVQTLQGGSCELQLNAEHYTQVPPEQHPFWYHATNVSLHMFNVVLLLYTITGALSSVASNWTLRLAWDWAYAAAMLFAVHPVHTEAVSGIVGRAEVLCAAFYLLSLLSYVRAMEHSLLGIGFVHVLCSMVLFICSILSKVRAQLCSQTTSFAM